MWVGVLQHSRQCRPCAGAKKDGAGSHWDNCPYSVGYTAWYKPLTCSWVERGLGCQVHKALGLRDNTPQLGLTQVVSSLRPPPPHPKLASRLTLCIVVQCCQGSGLSQKKTLLLLLLLAVLLQSQSGAARLPACQTQCRAMRGIQ